MAGGEVDADVVHHPIREQVHQGEARGGGAAPEVDDERPAFRLVQLFDGLPILLERGQAREEVFLHVGVAVEAHQLVRGQIAGRMRVAGAEVGQPLEPLRPACTDWADVCE